MLICSIKLLFCDVFIESFGLNKYSCFCKKILHVVNVLFIYFTSIHFALDRDTIQFLDLNIP